MNRLLVKQDAADTSSKRHHYVPQTYLREWSFDRRRIWSLDTVTHIVKLLGLASVCVQENFYRVVGSDGAPHNKVELLFGVVDNELRRVEQRFLSLDDPDSLELVDLLGLGVTMAVQRMRTLQQRRLRRQQDRWLVAQDSTATSIEDGPNTPHRMASDHTQLLYSAMWSSADVLTTRHIELWDDPDGRFTTGDAPVLVPSRRGEIHDLDSAPHIIWPISAWRTIVLTHDHTGQKATIRQVNGKMLGFVRDAVEQGRERMIFASDSQRDRLPATKLFRRRMQTYIRCAPISTRRTAADRACRVEIATTFAAAADIKLCNSGLHSPTPDLRDLT